MASPVSIGDIITTCEKAYKTVNAIKRAPSEFQSLSREAITLNSTLKSLADIARVDASILQRAGPQKEEELRLVLEGCHQSLDNIREIMWKYSMLKDRKKTNVLDRVKFASEGKQELRDKLVLHTASVNIFLTTLTHMSLARIERGLDNYESDFDAAPSRPFPRPPLGRVWDLIGWELHDSGVSGSLLEAKYHDTIEHILGVTAQWRDGVSNLSLFHNRLSASHHSTHGYNVDQERTRIRSRDHDRLHALQQNDISRMRSWERRRPPNQSFHLRNIRREQRVSSISDDVTPMETSNTSQDEITEVIAIDARDSSPKAKQPKSAKRQQLAHKRHEESMNTDLEQETLPGTSMGKSHSKRRVRQGLPVATAGLGSAVVAGLYEKNKAGEIDKETRRESRAEHKIKEEEYDEKAHSDPQHLLSGLSLPPESPSSPSSLPTDHVRTKRRTQSRKENSASARHKGTRYTAQHAANPHEPRDGKEQDYDSDVEDLVDLFKEATAIDESLLVPGMDDLWDYGGYMGR